MEETGYLHILTTEKRKTRNALLTYRNKDGVEHVFNMAKNNLGCTRPDSTPQGKVFCTMTADMIANLTEARITETRDGITQKMT